MATDVAVVLANLLGFYEFDNKIRISVGAGGGQFGGYGRVAQKVIAVDPDGAVLAALAERTRALGIGEKVVPLERDLMAVRARADVVLFEFSLHELHDPAAALARAAPYEEV
jgi:predicted RNA methylase